MTRHPASGAATGEDSCMNCSREDGGIAFRTRAPADLPGHDRTAPAGARLVTAVAMILLALTTVPARAQREPDAFLQQQRRIEEEAREQLNRELPADRRFDLDYGAWYSFYLMLFDDGIESSRTYRMNDLRIWGSASLDQGAHQFYGRLKLQYEDFNTGDSYDGNDDDWVGPNLDRAFYQFDLRRALRAYEGEQIDWNLNVKAGRDLVEFGTGYALSLPLDHVMVTGELGDWRVQGLAAASIRSTNNIDRSHPNGPYSERCFWGTQITYTGFERHQPFAYAFWNKDQLTERHPVPYQNWDYDSWYVGLGSTGELFRDTRYWGEWVLEGGDTYGHHEWVQQDTIKAWALDLGIEYFTRWPMSPRFNGEYMFASGDPDRYGSPTDSVGGNLWGADLSFVGFGYRDTGLSFSPLLSNVHIWRLGAAFTPFEDMEALRDLELGTDWYLYCKNHGEAAVSDPTADRGSNYLGWEMDYFLNWRFTSDLAWTTRFGTFFPGSSFSDQTTRTFLLTGITWSF
jgi:hypothetical protein